MMRYFLTFFLVLIAATALHAQTKDLRIYWTDVEGGTSTLIVTPSGQSLLADTGFAGDRDPQRIMQTLKTAGVSKIDVLIISHYHGDHVGGLTNLTNLIPIDKIYDHGDSIETGTPAGAKTYADYKTAAGSRRITAKPGDKIPLRGLDVSIISADGQVIDKPVKGGGAPNDLCKDAQQKDPDKTENSRSVGFILTYGKFKFLDLGDLTWDKEMMLACPVNKIGTVNLFQASHHGFSNGASGSPAFVWAIKPQVVVVNDGARKGFVADSYTIISKIPNLEDIWQLHRSFLNSDAAHNTSEQLTANPDEADAADRAFGIEVSVTKDGGAFTVTNARNNFSKTYTSR